MLELQQGGVIWRRSTRGPREGENACTCARTYTEGALERAVSRVRLGLRGVHVGLRDAMAAVTIARSRRLSYRASCSCTRTESYQLERGSSKLEISSLESASASLFQDKTLCSCSCGVVVARALDHLESLDISTRDPTLLQPCMPPKA